MTVTGLTAGSGPRTLRVAVLICFAIPERISATRGLFDKLFNTWIQKSLAICNEKRSPEEQWKFEVTGYDVVEEGAYPNAEDIDALIVTGSVASAYDTDPWIQKLSLYLQDIFLNQEHVRIFGGCFGHQIVSQALLSQHKVHVEKSPRGWEIGVHQITLTPEFCAHFPNLLGKGATTMSFQFLHADHVVIGDKAALPGGWVQVGTTDLCDVHGVLYPGRVLTFQGHPEFDAFINGESTTALMEMGKFTEVELAKHMEFINKEDQALLAGQLLVEFLVRDR